MKENDMQFVVNCIDKILMNADDTSVINAVKKEVNAFMTQFVLYPELDA
jgi:glycine hydroxymethyltransferase